MSRHYSANQYEGAFKSSQLQNWQVPKTKVEARPKKYEGYSVFNSNDRGYLLSDATRSKESPWGSFIGTWDMPTKIPGNRISNATARHPSSAKSLRNMREEFEEKIKNPKVAVAPSTQSPTKQNEKVNVSNSAEVDTERGPGSRQQTPKSPPTCGPKRDESPSFNKVSVPTPLGLQEPDLVMKPMRTPSRESGHALPTVNAEGPVEMLPGSKPLTPKTPFQDMGRTEELVPVQSPAALYEQRAVNCSPCPSKRSVGPSVPTSTINWPAPNSGNC